MKRQVTKALLLSLMAAAVVSCAEDEGFDSVESGSTSQQTFMIEIEASQGVEESTTRASYGETGEFSWTAGDQFILAYQLDSDTSITLDSDTSTTRSSTYNGSYFSEFTTQEDAKSAYFTGEVMPFEGDTTVYACYFGHSFMLNEAQYNIDFENQSIYLHNSHLTGWSNTSNATATVSGESMGCMVAAASGASVESAENYYIPALNFKQVASFFQFELQDHPDDLTIEYISLMPTWMVEHYISGGEDLDNDYNTFVDEADVSLESGEIISVSGYDDEVGFEIDSEYDRNNPFFTLPLFPCDVAEDLTLMLEVEGDDGSYYIYYYDLGTGVNFKRNTIHRKSGLSWNDFTVYTYSSVIPLSNFDDETYIPAELEWIIDTEGKTDLTADDLAGLRRALSNESLAAGSIELSFEEVTSFGAEAMKGDLTALGGLFIEISEDIYIGDAAFAGNTNLEYLYVSNMYDDGADLIATMGEGVFEGCTSMEDCQTKSETYPTRTFKDCSSLYWIDMDVTSIGESAFENCTSLYAYEGSTYSSLDMYSIKEIGARAFYNCDQFTSININRWSGITLDYLGAEAFHRDAADGTSESYTPNVELYTNSFMQGNVDYKTFSFDTVSYEFAKIFVDGVEQTEGGDVVIDPQQPSTGDDADVEEL